MTSYGRFQFSIRRLLVLTTTVAAVLAISRSINTPLLFQGTVAVYFGILAGWLILRGPGIYVELIEIRRRLRKLRQKREEIESEVEKRKEHSGLESRSLRTRLKRIILL